MATRAATQNPRKTSSCVTTPSIRSLVSLGFGRLPAGAFRAPMALSTLRARPRPPLSSQRLPALDLTQAGGILTVPLVPSTRCVPAFAAFAQASSRPRPTWAGCALRGFASRLLEAHGEVQLPGVSPSGRATSSRALLHVTTTLPIVTPRNEALPQCGPWTLSIGREVGPGEVGRREEDRQAAPIREGEQREGGPHGGARLEPGTGSLSKPVASGGACAPSRTDSTQQRSQKGTGVRLSCRS